MGLLDSIFGGVDDIKKSDAFSGVEGIGEAFSKELLSLFDPAEENQSFQTGSARIRDQLSKVSATSRQRLGSRAATGGFSDSGAVNEGLADIDRSELDATSNALQRLILGLEDRKFSAVLPFLSNAANENFQVGSANQQAQIAVRGQNIGFASTLIEAAPSFPA